MKIISSLLICLSVLVAVRNSYAEVPVSITQEELFILKGTLEELKFCCDEGEALSSEYTLLTGEYEKQLNEYRTLVDTQKKEIVILTDKISSCNETLSVCQNNQDVGGFWDYFWPSVSIVLGGFIVGSYAYSHN